MPTTATQLIPISICRNHSTDLKTWQNGNIALRWCAAGLVEASKQFRRVNAPTPTKCSGQPFSSMSASRVSVPIAMLRT